jgi:1-acyl-sn-glycerol-3-phosphate acyltransferase
MDKHLEFTKAYGNSLIGAYRAFSFVTALILSIPLQMVWRQLRPNDALFFQIKFYRFLISLMNFKVTVTGEMSRVAPTLFVCNHTSYLDIVVLGSVIPASFVAKADVAKWPLIGLMSRLLNTVFIERRASQAGNQRSYLSTLLEQGRSLILFPEGTSSDGIRALPFKSSLFSIVEDAPADKPMTVQPVSIICAGVGGLPMVRAWRAHYAWYGDMTLVGHLWNVFKVGGYRIDIVFHPAVKAKDFNNRKALSAYCHDQVARGIETSLTGRQGNLLAGAKAH